MNTLAWIGVTQSLFAAVLMFTKKSSTVPDKILSGWLTLLSIEFLTCGLDHTLYGKPLLSSSFLLFNPALFIYVSSLTRSDFTLRGWQLLHLVPFLVFEIMAYAISEPFKPEQFFHQNPNYWFRILFSVVNIVSWVVYIPLSLIIVHRYRLRLREEISNIDKNENLGWILSVAIFYIVYCIVALIISAIAILNNQYFDTPHLFNYSTLLVLVFMLSFYGLRQQEVKNRYPIEIKKTYQNSLLSQPQKTVIAEKLWHYMQKEKAYLNSDLKLESLAAALKIPKYQLTEVLNTHIGKNFFQFVNEFRVKAVQETLLNPNNKFSIEAVGYDCGFSSKSVFYLVFKKETGMTPSEFIRQNHSENQEQ